MKSVSSCVIKHARFYPQVFGALASEPFKVSDGFYGTGETFVFTFCPEFEVRKDISTSQEYKKRGVVKAHAD